MDREDGGESTKLLVRLGKKDNSARFSPFLSKLFPQVHETRAALVHGAGRTAVIGMAECLISLLKGIYAVHLTPEICTDWIHRHQPPSDH